MTVKELHLEYKKETGEYPAFNYQYIEWLENKVINLSVKFTIDGKILTSVIKQKNKEK